MPRLGRTAFLRREYRRTLDPDRKTVRETAQEAEARRRQAARQAARGSV